MKRNLSINCHKRCSSDMCLIAYRMNNMYGGTGSVTLKEYFKHVVFEFLVENSEMTSSFAIAVVSFFSKPSQTS